MRTPFWLLLAATLAINNLPLLQGADTAQRKKKEADSGPRRDDDAPKFRPSRAVDKVVVFKTTPQGQLKLHFYLPPGWSASDRRPAMVLWFGGGFNHGTPSQFFWQADYFASRGLVTVCPEYRVKGTHGTLIDKCVEDARSAMRWVKSHAGELGIAPDKVIASGGSAGGTLSLLVARATGPDATDDDVRLSPRPCALVLFNPAMGERVLRVIGKAGASAEQALVSAQVMELNTPQKDEPPTIMFFGTEDREFLEVAREFCRKADAQGTRCEVWTADKNRHGFFNGAPWHEATARKADEFLTSLGYLQGPPKIKADPAAVLMRFDPMVSANSR
ncbi:MAG: alpha/beta hydrolase [Opitutaceae bacterium]|nr:alpha/beta hydrolase [Opitutaceae bacterium]